jgi:mRNA interferase HigB
MRIITLKRLIEAGEKHPAVKPAIEHWANLTKAAKWVSLADTRATFSHADQAIVKSKRTVTIFNLRNSHRLITAIHYNTGIVFVLMVLTHADYSKDAWKKVL